jgi:hypothetical protein
MADVPADDTEKNKMQSKIKAEKKKSKLRRKAKKRVHKDESFGSEDSSLLRFVLLSPSVSCSLLCSKEPLHVL